MAHAIDATVAPGMRLRITRIVAGLVAVLVLVGLGSAPALIVGFADRGDIHAFHGVEWGALAGVLFAGSMLVVALRPPRSQAALRSLLAIGLSFVGVAAFARVLGQETVTPLLLAVIVASLAGPRLLAGDWRPRSMPLAVMALIAGVSGLINAAVQIGYQLERSADLHAMEMHYAGSAVFTIAIPAVAYIVSTLPDGFKTQAWLVGAASVLLGIGSLVIQRTGAFAALPAVLTILWGTAFVVLAHTVPGHTASN